MRPGIETNRAKVLARLEREGWINEGGKAHDKLRHLTRPGLVIMVPRHATLTPGVARSMAKAAGWI